MKKIKSPELESGRKSLSRQQLKFIIARRAERFKNLFKGRDDAWGKLEGGCVREPLTERHFTKHIQGQESIGIYPMLDDGRCNFACIDLDFKSDPNREDRALEEAQRIYKKLSSLGLKPMFEISKSGLIHVWVFFSEPVKAIRIRKILKTSIEDLGLKLGNGEVEIFPKQDKLNPGQVGNYINLPYFDSFQKAPKKRVMIDSTNFTPISIGEFLDRAEKSRVSKKLVDKVYDELLSKQSDSWDEKRNRAIEILSKYWIEGNRQDLALYTAGFLKKRGITWEQTEELILEVANNAGDEEIKQRMAAIKSTFQRAEKGEDIKGHSGLQELLSPEDLQTLCALFSAVATKQGEPQKKNYKALFPGLVDLVMKNNEVVFLIKEGGKLNLQSHVDLDGETYYPPPRESLPFHCLPRAEKVLKYYQADSDEKLYDDLRSYHVGVSELPDDKFYDLLVAWDFHTYILDSFQFSPFIWLYAVPERGKSRTGKGCIYVAYRGIHVESLKEAYIFRLSDNLQATVFFDVRDLWKKAEREKSEDLLLLRFERGAQVPRVLFPDRGPFKDTKFFDIFGATIIGTNKPVHDIMATRALMITMAESSKSFEDDVTPEKALPLKERLVAFRARHLGNALPDLNKPARGRLGDILKPLFQIIKLVKPNKEKTLLRLTRDLQASRRAQHSETNYAHILRVIISQLGTPSTGWLRVKDITDIYNAQYAGKYKYSYKKMGQELDALGFNLESGTKKKINVGTVIKLDLSMIIKLSLKYGVSFGLKQVHGYHGHKGHKGHAANNNSDFNDDASGLSLEDMKRSLEQH